MRNLPRAIRSLSLGLLWLSSGCFLRPQTVISRFSGEYVCPEANVKVEQVDKTSYRASGCNRRALYACSGEYGELCQRVGQPETIRPEGQEEQAPPPGGEPAAPPPEAEPAAP